MSKTLPFTGSGVAIITPFDGLKTNYDELGKLIEYHIENNTDAIIICGTTGEASTMPDEEHLAAIKYTVEKAAGRITVIAGTGSNDTAHAIELSKKAEEYRLQQNHWTYCSRNQNPFFTNVPSRTMENIVDLSHAIELCKG